MRQIFEFLSIFDWITPVAGFMEDLVNDPTPLQSNSWTFFLPYDQTLGSGWNAFDVKKLLNRHGVKSWGTQITGGELFFSVKLEQAQWAEYLLQRHGIPIHEKSSGSPRPKRSPTQKEQPKDIISRFWDDFILDQPPPQPQPPKPNRDELSFLDDIFGKFF